MITLSDIRRSPTVINDLASQFDFDLDRASRDNSWITLEPKEKFIVLAGESSGGVFLAYGEGDVERLPILYATSEGQAGLVASNLTELLAMMMALPYWPDLLKFSGGGNLSEMRRAAVFMAREYVEEYPDLPDTTSRIMDSLPIPLLPDPIKLLHDRVHATDCSLVADDGWRYETLFNGFKSSDNPNWK